MAQARGLAAAVAHRHRSTAPRRTRPRDAGRPFSGGTGEDRRQDTARRPPAAPLSLPTRLHATHRRTASRATLAPPECPNQWPNALNPPEQPKADSTVALALALTTRATTAGHRRLLLLDGDADWGRAAAEAIANALRPAVVCRIGNGALADALPPARAAALLGGECDLLIIDAHAGLDADALGAAAGTLRGGGLLLLLAPTLSDWPAGVDPEAARIAVHPLGAADVTGRFVGRLARLLAGDPAVGRVSGAAGAAAIASASDALLCLSTSPADATRAAPETARAPDDLTTPATADQRQAVEAVLRVANGRARRPLVLSSDRGRGKSAALGIAAGRLLAGQQRRILVTAPRRAAVDALFRHAHAVAPAAADALGFIAPDALLAERPAADLLLVDEAAGIPAPLLARMLAGWPRVVFATTVHGYEGTGRGFEVRFRGVLERLTPGWHWLRLRAPVRWRAGDPLERLIDRALLLDAEPAPDDEVTARTGAHAADLTFEPLDRDRLAADEPLLRQVFGLLVLGHYQTRPADLRHLLDGPNLSVAVLRDGETVLATALTAREGELPDDLLGPIFDGRRRPRGHLLAQTLSAHGGLLDAPRLGYSRIVRIAVHPAARGRGLGQRLVGALADEATAGGRDFIGASFGATAGLIRFWRRCALLPVQLGSRRNAASGAHAAVVLRPLSDAGTALFATARGRWVARLGVLLSGPLRDVEPDVAAALLRGAPGPRTVLDAAAWREIRSFAGAARGLDAALPALHALACARLPGALEAGIIDLDEAALLIAAVLQHQPLAHIAGRQDMTGRDAALRRLRAAVGRLLENSD